MMVSEWMVNGDINKFVKANIDADRLELVCSVSSPSITIDNYVVTVAERRHQRIDLHA